jgi:hypothetical protein
MKTYKIYKGLDSVFHNFNSLAEAEQFVIDNYDNTWSVVLASDSEQITPLTIEDRLPFDIDFGHQIINEFLLDNRLHGYISIQDSINLLNKFSDIEKLSRLGAIKDVEILMQNVIVDDIFTQARKDKYLAMITEYLNYYK